MQQTNEIRRVIVAVLDGLRPDAIDAFDLNHVRRLARLGASTMRGRTVSPSLTWPALTSLMTGVAPDVHDVVADTIKIPRPRKPIVPLPQLLLRHDYPSFAFMHDIPAIYGMFATRITERLGFTSTRFTGDTALDVVMSARPTLSRELRGFFFFHLADADRAGHDHGWMSLQYGDGARTLDSALALLASSLDLESDPRTLLIALADHGGGGVDNTDHEGEHPLNCTIPVIAAGARLPHRALGAVHLLDVPATTLWALGVDIPRSYSGRVLAEAFAPDDASAVA
jgi:predicted AlkP superfamily pyrophosphatase or phosphodiesterase